MNKRRSILTLIMLIISIIVFIPSCKKEDDTLTNNDDVQEEGIKDNVVLINEQTTILLSDSTQKAQGEYILQYSDAPTAFQTGDVIVGQTNMGYLRKIISSSVLDNITTLQTEQATMEDLFVNSQVNIDLPYDDSKRAHQTNLAKGVSEMDGSGINLSLSNFNLLSESDIDVSITSATISIQPNFKYDHNYQDGTLKSMSIILPHTPIEFDYNIAINGTVSSSDLTEKILFEKSMIYFTPTFIPIVIGINHKVKLVFKPTAGVGIDYNYHEILKYNYDLGAEYADNSFTSVLNKNSSSESVINNSMEVRADGNMKVSLIYEPTMYVYGVKGPYLINDLNGTINGSINSANDWNLNLNLDASSTAGIEFTVYSDFLVKKESTQEWFNKKLYTAPDSAFIISGNNQEGSIDTELENPVKIRVTDDFGYGTPNVKVYFTPLSDNGTVEDEFVYTNNDGYAQTTWTLGEAVEEQELKALVKNANGSYIKNIPLTFLAISGNGCGGQTFLTYGAQNYDLVEIGNQCWMADNLNYQTANSWWYDNNSTNGLVYGRLYTWNAALNACPTGWHLPSDSEWKTMEMTLGMSQSEADHVGMRGTDEGEKMKSTSGWNNNGTNSSGFNALPGGLRWSDGYFEWTGNEGNWWSSTEYSGSKAWFRVVINSDDQVYRNNNYLKTDGLSVRCIKD